MFTLLTTVVSFLTGGLPSILGFFQNKADQSHEIEMARLQMERDLKMAEAGYQKLDTRYRQAVREAEKKEKEGKR